MLPLLLDALEQCASLPDVSAAAAMALSAALPQLPQRLVVDRIVPFALSKADVSQKYPHRMNSCRVLGGVARQRVLPATDVERLFLRPLLALCQDTEYSVRSLMALQLPALAEAVR